jgi:heme oxygenase
MTMPAATVAVPRRASGRHDGADRVTGASLTDDADRSTTSRWMVTQPLSRRLRDDTQDLHTIAERSGIMRPLLRGTLEPRAYARLLRNLYAIYAALEGGLRQHAGHAVLAPFAHDALFRLDRLERDLLTIEGPDWRRSLETTETARRYADRLATGDAWLLLAHAYVRYLGDLSGGQHIARIVRRALGAGLESAVEFYDFTELGDLEVFKAQVRSELDRIQPSADCAAELVAEARWAFEAHAELFNELEAMRAGGAHAASADDKSR